MLLAKPIQFCNIPTWISHQPDNSFAGTHVCHCIENGGTFAEFEFMKDNSEERPNSLPVPQELAQGSAPGSRLVRYGPGSGPCFSNSTDALSATCELARRSGRPGNIFASPAWPTRPVASRVCWPCGSRVYGNNAGVDHSDNREEKVPCSSGTCVGSSAASSVPKSKGTSIGRPSETMEENPAGRKLRPEKKEEEFSANLLKKTQRKKIPFLVTRFASVRFHQLHQEINRHSAQQSYRATIPGVKKSGQFWVRTPTTVQNAQNTVKLRKILRAMSRILESLTAETQIGRVFHEIGKQQARQRSRMTPPPTF